MSKSPSTVLTRRKLVIVEQSAVSTGGHYFNYSMAIAFGASKAGFDVFVLGNKRFDPGVAAGGICFLPTFSSTWGEAEAAGPAPCGDGNFAYELERALSRIGVEEADIILIHTIGYVELESLLGYFNELPVHAAQPTFHIVLRYDPEYILANHSKFARHWASLRKENSSRHIRFHSDTNLLAEAFSNLTGLPFGVAPIPFNQTFLRKEIARPARPEGSCLVIAYLGDARVEKGYLDLPGVVAGLWEEYVRPGKIRFVIQSNFNVPGGEAGILAAQRKLARYDAVELVDSALDASRYYGILTDADLVLVPYSADRYRLRSSGILVEAMAAGKPIVTSVGSWMATQVSADHSELFAGPTDLAPAVRRILRAWPEKAAAAAHRAKEVLFRSSPEEFVKYLSRSNAADGHGQNARDRPRILFVFNGDATVLQNGANHIVRSQLRYFNSAGYGMVGLCVTHQRYRSQTDYEGWLCKLLDALREFEFEELFVSGPSVTYVDRTRVHRLDHAARMGIHSVALDLEAAADYNFSARLVSFTRDNKFDAIFLNYITTLPMARALRMGPLPLICEMHDVQSFQKAIYGRRSICKEDLAKEFAGLSHCAHLLSLNEQETDFVKSRLPDIPITTTGIFFDPIPSKFGDIAGAKNVAEIVSSARPCNPEYCWEDAWRSGNTAEIRRLTDTRTFDLLFVSSSHEANVSGLVWFLDEVYLPFLAARDISLVVAGSIGQLGSWPRFPSVFFVGQVESTAPLYAATRIVILPVKQGAGAAVKTFEALSRGKPIVATADAIRGFERELRTICTRDEPAEFAEALLELLGSSESRAASAEQSLTLATNLFGMREYTGRMNGVMHKVLGRRALKATLETVPHDAFQHVEWSPPLRAINKILRNWLEGEVLDGDELDFLARQDMEWVQQVSLSVSQAFMDARAAPLILSLENMTSRFGREMRGFAVTFASLVHMATRRCHDQDISPTAPGRMHEVVVYRGFEFNVTSRNHSGRTVLAISLDGTSGIISGDSAGGFHSSISAIRQPPYLSLVSFGDDREKETSASWVVWQRIPIRSGSTVFGLPVFGPGWVISDTSSTREKAGLRGANSATIRLPYPFSESGYSYIVFEFSRSTGATPPELTGRIVGLEDAVPIRFDPLAAIAVLELPNRMSDTAVGVCEIEFTSTTSSAHSAVHLLAITSAWSPMGQTLKANELPWTMVSDRETCSPEQECRNAFEEMWPCISLGASLPPSVAALVQSARHHKELFREVLSDELSRVASPREHGADMLSGRELNRHLDRLLDPGELAGTASLLISPVLPLAIAVPISAAHATLQACNPSLLLSNVQPEAGSVLYRRADNSSVPWRSWSVEMPPSIEGARAIIELEGFTNSARTDEMLLLENAYGVEVLSDGRVQRWAGGRPELRVLFPIWSRQGGDIMISVVNPGENRVPEDLVIEVDGQIVGPLAVSRETHGVTLRGRIGPSPPGLALGTMLRVRYAKTFRANGDARELGICFGRVRFEYSL
jgi:glycosyltransferase involved in cell wall biosynthesis